MPAPELVTAQSHVPCGDPASTVLFVGTFSNERVNPTGVAVEFGFQVESFASIEAFDARFDAPDSMDESNPAATDQRISAVLLHENADDAGWLKPLLLLTERYAGAKVILCRRFRAAEHETPADLAALGVFLTLRLPLSHAELRQAFGFVWASAQTGTAEYESARTQQQLAAISRRLRRETQSELESKPGTLAQSMAQNKAS